MNTYVVKGTYRQINARGIMEPFEIKVKARSNNDAEDTARFVLSATHEHIHIKSCEYGGYDSDVIYFDTSKIRDTSELKQAVKESKAPYFFDASTMRFFNSRLSNYIMHTSKGVIFITSEKYDHDSARFYTVRMFTNEGRVNTLSEFQQFETLAQAKRFARDY